MNTTKIILNPDAPAAREISLNRADTVPDLWHIGQNLQEHGQRAAGNAVLECWHLSHDLMNFIRALDSAGGLQVTIERAIDRIEEYLTDSEEIGLNEDSGREQCEAWAEALQGYAGMLTHFPRSEWGSFTEAEIKRLIATARTEAKRYPEPEKMYKNVYRCDCGGNSAPPLEWCDIWSAASNDKCSNCGREIEPHESKEI